MFDWFRSRRRRRIIQRPTPEAWPSLLGRHVWQFSRLSANHQEKLINWIKVFIVERHWEGCDGLDLTEEMKVVVAGQAGLLVLGHDQWYFDRTPSILVYPAEYTVANVPRGIGGGFTLVGDEERLGEAWYRGPIILSWPQVLSGGRSANAGHNLVFHEFSHHLDMIGDPDADGKPPLPNQGLDTTWDRVVPREFDRLRHMCANGFPTLLSCYGATSRAEFFAVASENYFQRPAEFKQQLPELFEVFRSFYQIDCSLWVLS